MGEDTTLSTQANHDIKFLTHHNTDYSTRDCFDHGPSANNIGQRPKTTIDSGKFEAIGTEGFVHGNEEKYAGVSNIL